MIELVPVRLATLALLALGGCHLVLSHAPRPGGVGSEAGAGDGGLDARVRDGVADLGPARLSALAFGSAHACALYRDGGVRCWGWNDWGMLGDGTTGPAATAIPVKDLPPARAIAAGAVHTCAIAADRVYCWGYGGWSQLGKDVSEQLLPLAMPDADATGKAVSVPEQLALGHQHTCRLGRDARVHCSGRNDHGQLGDGSGSVESLALVEVAGLAGCKVKALASGLHHACALCASGEVRCWGRNDLGQVGDGTSADALTATPVTLEDKSPLADAVALFAGSHAACARRAGGAVVCWGENRDLQLTGSTPSIRRRAEPLATSQRFDELALASRHSCGLDGGRVFCWGANLYGSLGDGKPPVGQPLPKQVAGLAGVRQLAAGGATSCALLHDEVRCWGANGRGQIGAGHDGVSPPVRVNLGGGPLLASAIDAGERHTCAASKDGRVYCWGRGTSGELGSPAVADPAPREVLRGGGPFEGATRVSAGFAHSCAIEGSEAYCWGWNEDGQLGIGGTSASSPPTVVANLGALEARAGNRHTCFVDQASKAVRCAGSNQDGRLGLGKATPSESATPLAVASLGAVDSLAVGDEASCARVGDTLRCWGSNWSGVLGVGDMAPRLAPTAVAGIGRARDPIAIGRHHACAQQDQTGIQVTCWGRGSHGELGSGTTSSTLKAGTVVADLADVKDLDASPGMEWTGAHTCAIDGSDVVLCWGWNAWGQLGAGARSSLALKPQPVAGLPKAKRVTTGTHHSCAISEKDEVWCWGYNGDGQLGSGALPIVPQPTPVLGL